MGNKDKSNRELDCVGLYCPETVFMTRQEVDKLDVGEALKLVAGAFALNPRGDGEVNVNV